MSFRRKVALSIAGLVALLLTVVALVPMLFRDRIEARLKAAVADRMAARVDWRRLDAGLLRSFPNLSLQLRDVSVTGSGAFAGDTLLAVPRFRLVLDLGSVLRSVRGDGALVVRSVELRGPAARLIVLENGAANWDIFPERESARSRHERSFDFSLRRLVVRDARIGLDNRQSGVSSTVAGLDHSLSGDFRKRHFTLKTTTSADSVSLRFAGVPYLSRVRLEVDAQLAADLDARTFTLRDNRLRLNELLLNAEGSVKAGREPVEVDVAFKTPRTEFRDILSLVPVVYARQFATLQTAGTMALAGHVRGSLGKDVIPTFSVNAHVDGGMFRYPDLPLPARDISFRLALTNQGGHVDSTVLAVDRLHVVLGSDPITGSLTLRTPVSDPDVDLRVSGRLDLANVPRTLKLEGVSELSGVVVANAALRARLSDVDQQRYERVSADGSVEMREFALAAADLRQPLHIDEATLRLTPRHAELTTFRGRAGSSDISMSGALDNLLGFMLQKEDLRGSADLASNLFDLNEWRSDDELKAIAVPGRIDFALRATAATVRYGDLELHNARGRLHIKDRRATLEDFRMDVLGGGMTLAGFYETLEAAPPTFDIALGLSNVDVPTTFSQIRTVQLFAPVARYAEGRVSAEVKLNGALRADMMPVYENLSGLGSLVTSGIVLRGFPALDRLADALKLRQLHDPGFIDLKSSFAIENGRLLVKPFDVRSGQLSMSVSGSNGIDQSIDYTLALHLPRAILGGEANRAVSGIIARSASAGFDLQQAETITLGVKLSGTITDPAVATTFRADAADAVQSVAQALRESAQARQQMVVDSASEIARQRVAAESARVLAEAEKRAGEIRAEAASLAEKLRQEGYAQADSLEARSSGVARIAAKAAADRLRRETDAKANALIREADTRAGAVVTEARQRAGASSPEQP